MNREKISVYIIISGLIFGFLMLSNSMCVRFLETRAIPESKK